MNKKQKKVLIRIIISGVMLLLINVIPIESLILKTVLSLIAYLIIGYDILRKAFLGIIHGNVFDENFLMAVATIGAIALTIYKNEKDGDYNEAIMVMLLYQIGELFQNIAVGKSRKSITALMDIRPDYANIEVNNELTQVSPEEVKVGSTIVVKPGEKIPLDGRIVSGTSTLNTSALTGESLPKEVSTGDDVISGCINMTGVLRIKTTKEYSESTAAKILDLVENASSRKSKSEDFISKFARIYTPAVCLSALALAILPPVFNIILSNDANWSTWVYRALTFLVISCPCALVISIPLSFFAGLGGASRNGVLIKGSNYLETLSKTKVVVFDKTGTLTKGGFEVNGIHHSKIKESELLEYAATAESYSSHPIAKSLQRAYGKKIDKTRVKDIKEISGEGLIAKVDNLTIAIGNTKLMNSLNIEYNDCHSIGTIIHVAIDDEYAGHIVISDIEKPNSRTAIAALKNLGVEKTVMLTGDAKRVAESVANDLGLDEVHYELLPADKVVQVEKLLKEKPAKSKLAFVGDGINDAPVLARADIGIAMGALGSDAAIEAADVVLMDDDPLKIAKGIKISRKCISIVYENIIFSFLVKFVCLALGAIGIANMWVAIFADVGVMIIAVLNAIRALK